MPQTITMILPMVKFDHGKKNLSSSFIIAWLESDLTMVKMFKFQLLVPYSVQTLDIL